MPIATLHTWQRVGWVHSRKVTVASGRWALWADPEELERLRQLRAYKRTWPEPRYPQALTTPKRQDMQKERAGGSETMSGAHPRGGLRGIVHRESCAMTSRTNSNLTRMTADGKSCGAAAIKQALAQQGIAPVPSQRTIYRILHRDEKEVT